VRESDDEATWPNLNHKHMPNNSVGIKAILTFPKDVYVIMIPPVPDRITTIVPAAVTLKNTTRSDFVLFAPTPCDVHFWELCDEAGNIIQTEPAGDCIEIPVTKKLPAGQSIRGDNVVELNGKLLLKTKSFVLKYKFWGHPCQASFNVIVLG
jgi:hypothetical protein